MRCLQREHIVAQHARRLLRARGTKEALGILSERDKHHEQELEEYQENLREPQQREKRAKEEAIESERERTERLLAAKEQEIQSLKERISQLCGTPWI
jgi:chromosome segregation ATPase